MAASNFVRNSGDFHKIHEVQFFRLNNSSYRATVVVVEGRPYVQLSLWYFNLAEANWCPTKKQLFLPKVAWGAFIRQVEELSRILEPLNDPTPIAGINGCTKSGLPPVYF